MRIRHNGTGYAQLKPPAGPVLFKTERFETCPPFLVWVAPKGALPFSSFFKPHFRVTQPGARPQEFSCVFSPDAARYRVVEDDIKVRTSFTISPDDPAILARVTVTNAGAARDVTITPVWRIHNTSSALQVWDVPELYQTCHYMNDPHQVVWVETRHPMGKAAQRLRSMLMTDMTPGQRRGRLRMLHRRRHLRPAAGGPRGKARHRRIETLAVYGRLSGGYRDWPDAGGGAPEDSSPRRGRVVLVLGGPGGTPHAAGRRDAGVRGDRALRALPRRRGPGNGRRRKHALLRIVSGASGGGDA